MKITCNREKLLSAFQLASSASSARSPKEILQNVKIVAGEEVVTLMGSDMDAGIRVNVEGVDVQTPGKALLSVQRIGSILRESGDEQLLFDLSDSTLSIQGKYSEFNLPSGNPDEFPTLSAFEESAYHEIPGRLFRQMVHRTSFAIDVESSRYALGGVLLELEGDQVVAVGTDGRRLAAMHGKGTSVHDHKTQPAHTIIPSKSLNLIERAISDKDEVIHIAARANDILIRTSQSVIYSRLVEGRFPNWKQVIPKRPNAIRISGTSGPFLQAIRMAAVVADAESRGVDFQFGEGSLVLASRTAEIGQSRIEVPIDYSGEVIKLMMDHRFVSDFLRVLDVDAPFTIEISTGSEPALFLTNDGYSYVVMPMARDH